MLADLLCTEHWWWWCGLEVDYVDPERWCLIYVPWDA